MKRDPVWMYLSDAGHFDMGSYLEANWITYLFWYYRQEFVEFPVEIKPQLEEPYRKWAFDRYNWDNSAQVTLTFTFI